MPQDEHSQDLKDDERTITLLRSTPLTPIHWEPVPDTFTQVEGPGTPRTFSLEAERVVIGRSSRTDIQVISSMISRQHVFLWRSQDQEYVLEDMDSQNGVLLNGVPVHSVALRDGDRIQLGDVVFVYRRGSAWPSS